MKNLKVTITLEMSVPDHWELVPAGDGVDVLKLADGEFMDLTFEPLLTNDPEGTWSSTDDDDFLNELLDMIDSEDVVYELSPV